MKKQHKSDLVPVLHFEVLFYTAHIILIVGSYYFLPNIVRLCNYSVSISCRMVSILVSASIYLVG